MQANATSNMNFYKNAFEFQMEAIQPYVLNINVTADCED